MTLIHRVKDAFADWTWRRLLLAVLLGVTACVFLALIVGQIRAYRSEGLFVPRTHHARGLFMRQATTTEEIQSWMTFDYLNKTFSLPPNVLKDAIHLQSVRYPNLSIDRAARIMHENPNVVLNQVKTSIEQSSSTKATSH